MEIKTEQEVEEYENNFYIDFENAQISVKLNKDEVLKIQVLDKDTNVLLTRTYTAKYINTHFDLRWQDKGVKSEEELYEYVKTLKT